MSVLHENNDAGVCPRGEKTMTRSTEPETDGGGGSPFPDGDSRLLWTIDKHASIRALLDGLIHDINSTNQVVISNASLALDLWRDAPHIEERSAPTGAEMTAYLNGIIDGTRRLDERVRFLDSYIQERASEEPEWVDVNLVVDTALHLTSTLVRRSTSRMRTCLSPELPPLRSRPVLLQQVMVDLIRNACEALPSRDRAVEIVTRLDGEDGAVVIEIADEGRGIDARRLESLTRRRPRGGHGETRRGMGLGLTVSRAIVESLGGALSLRSEVERGTTVTVSLPSTDPLYGEVRA